LPARLLILRDHRSDFAIDLLSHVLVQIFIVFVESFERVEDLRFESERHSSGAIGEFEERIAEHLIILNN
jgi:hypothetical protein